MSLTLIGLILSFGGSAYLVLDTLINFGKPRSVTSIIHKGENRPPECIRYKRQKDGWLKEVKITPEERTLLISFSLLIFGFLLQILDFII